jgi:membrane protein implicated in regulation of membrane protease activity
MNLDLRIPMGLMFTLVGAMLTAFGLATRGSAIYALSLGINVNLWWGLVLLAFGLTMLLLGRRRLIRRAKLPPEPVAEQRKLRGGR